MNTAISIMSIQQLFTAARTHQAWQDRDIADGLLHEIYDLAKWGQHSTMPRWIRPFLKTPHGSGTFFATLATAMLQSFTRAVRALVLIKPASLHKELRPGHFPTTLPIRHNADQI
jgi:3-hydroxypropanoate dehydrogenase